MKARIKNQELKIKNQELQMPSTKLSQLQAKRCYTSSGVLIHDKKVLLVKHKLLGMWLPPGGHWEKDELPHKAAEREFWEETGIKVMAVSHEETLTDTDTEFLPLPLTTNLHWISEANYHKRINGKQVQRFRGGKACEQHVVMMYLVKPKGSLAFRKNVEEVDAIGWFEQSALNELETVEDVKQELRYAFEKIK